MINFRFHLASLVAVFLALALGIVMGSTVIDRAIVDTLRNRIDRVEHNANVQRRENNDLRDDLDRVSTFVDRSAPFAVTNRLDGVPLAVVASRAAGDDPVNATVELAVASGAQVPGVLWLEDKWVDPDDDARKELADLVGGSADDDDASLRTAAWTALADRLAAATAPETGDLLAGLRDAGFVTLDGVGDDDVDPSVYPGVQARVLLVDASDADTKPAEVVKPAVDALVRAELPLVVAEVFRESSDGPDRGSRVGPVRGDDGLQAVVSTVDDLETAEGRVAAVLALSDLGRGVIGHYGFGSGATRDLPEWTPP